MTEHILAKINRPGIALRYDSNPGFHSLDFHAHEEYEIFYFIDGQMQYYLEDKAYSLVPGDLLLIPPSVMHRAVVLDENAVYQRYVMMLSHEYCAGLMKGVPGIFSQKNAQPMRICLGPEENKDFRRKIEEILALENDAAGYLACDSLCTLLLLQFQRYAQGRQEFGESAPQQAQEILRYINANFTLPISVEDIARHFFISKTHLMRLFKQYTHTTVHNYITAKRILLAKALLKESRPMGEVSNTCGFSSYPSFYQAFLRHVGIGPSQYMQENREGQR